jgi:DNA-binding transcriptional ArsR family regulator
VTSEWDPRNVFDVFGDECARRILALASEQPHSAESLAEHLTISQPTVYRRLDVLEDYDLIHEDNRVDESGHHYTAYETNIESARFDVVDGEITIELTLTRDPLEPIE